MNGPHDLGGQHGLRSGRAGKRRALLSCRLGEAGARDHALLRRFRRLDHRREPACAREYPARHLSRRKLLRGLDPRVSTCCFSATAFATAAELARGPACWSRAHAPKRVLTADMVAAVLAKWRPVRPPRSRPGQRFAVRRAGCARSNFHPTGHTRLPRYARATTSASSRPCRAPSSSRTTTPTAGVKTRNGSIPSSSTARRDLGRGRSTRH
jgi:hypothetical protein